MPTSQENKLAILADLWMNYRTDEDFIDFIEYNDLGLPIAYALHENIVKPTELANGFVDETFSLLITGLGVSDDNDYESLEHLLDESEDQEAKEAE